MKIIGQETLVNDISRIFEIFKASEAKIRPHFILAGESGSGKTLTISTLAKRNKMQFLEINAAQLTKEGASGNSLSKALTPLLQFKNSPAIVFVDEFDKLFISGNTNSELSHESTNGVQNEFLKVLESNVASVFGDYGKYINVPVSNILFIFSGAFNGAKNVNIDSLRSYGVKTEFLGRVGLVYNTNKLSLDNMLEILQSSPLLDMYLNLFQKNKTDIINILTPYIKSSYEKNTIGARQINTLLHQYFIKGKLSSDEVEDISFQQHLTL